MYRVSAELERSDGRGLQLRLRGPTQSPSGRYLAGPITEAIASVAAHGDVEIGYSLFLT